MHLDFCETDCACLATDETGKTKQNQYQLRALAGSIASCSLLYQSSLSCILLPCAVLMELKSLAALLIRYSAK